MAPEWAFPTPSSEVSSVPSLISIESSEDLSEDWGEKSWGFAERRREMERALEKAERELAGFDIRSQVGKRSAGPPSTNNALGLLL